jgi:hypothetical protein
MVYGDFGDFGWRENKANSKPNKTNFEPDEAKFGGDD